MKDSLFNKFLQFSYGSFISLFIGLGSSMLITRIISPENLGKSSMYTLAISVLMIFIVFGTDQAFVRFFYEEDMEKRPKLLFNCVEIPMIILIFVSIIILLFGSRITTYLFGEKSFTIALALVFGTIFNVFNRYGMLVIRMQQKGKRYSNAKIINKVLVFIAIILFYLVIGGQYEIIIFSNLIALVISTILIIRLEKTFWNFDNVKQLAYKHKKLDIIKFSYPLMFTTIISWLFQSFDKIALREWSTFTELGLYAASFRIIALINVIQTAFTTFWTPVCYEHYEKKPNDTQFYERMFNIVSFFMLLIAVACISGKDFIISLLGKDFKAAANIMPFLVFMPVMYTVSETTVIGVNFAKKTNWHIVIAGISCLTNLIGNGILVPKYGAIGASIATAFSYIVFFTLRTVISLHFYRIKYGLKRYYLMIMLVCLYAVFSIVNPSFIFNILVGLIVLTLMCYVYRKEIKDIYYSYVKDKKLA
ncbi:Membrane protein involved in the export of O-antigen and teichoic acid [Dethiosulfatibacter aminovorans DSM 17477]|uniref:Membrane protein involved in the export of O-antigen and teichoic acid n=1 Tax=Dethiosulfatibacter aminovorans DSM 17477 TaxID=1121476 RepID=A0A1M6LMQ6_9FIRM|nr:oligosaccharide flippase family protein [Dethiosulfatibacter aminovorans]SHJ72447.1 Membrane protein involved in the export of O-antigen and teichoic acid [Dethiosulfatibacter aminovorans DSM 17477]